MPTITGLSPRDAQKRLLDLARGPTGPGKEQQIVDTLAALSPADRGECLRLINGRSAHHDVDHLVLEDIDDASLRQAALRLIDQARPHMASSGRVVVSDIDDTVKPGKDPNASGAVYPGARAFFAALDAGIDGTDALGDVHFVTARPYPLSSVPTKPLEPRSPAPAVDGSSPGYARPPAAGTTDPDASSTPGCTPFPKRQSLP